MKIALLVLAGLVGLSGMCIGLFEIGRGMGHEDGRRHAIELAEELGRVERELNHTRGLVSAGEAERAELQSGYDTVFHIAEECQGWLRESLARERVCNGR